MKLTKKQIKNAPIEMQPILSSLYQLIKVTNKINKEFNNNVKKILKD